MADMPRITSSLFVLSHSASAEIHMGLLLPPGSDKPAAPDLTEGAHLIEVIAMLEEKTAGNLEESEVGLIDAVLYDLRMRYVEASRTGKRVVEP